MFTKSNKKTGVVLMTYGSATTAEHVAEYFEHIYKGKASPELIADFENRYRLVGRSPLIEITNNQALYLQELLGNGYVVRAGMRHSLPFIKDAVDGCHAAGTTSLIGIILSPQFSSSIMEGYKTDFIDAADQCAFESVIIADPWPTEKHLIEFLAIKTKNALAKIKKDSGRDAPVIFTTHSLPRRVVEKDPNYLKQLQATIDAVRKKLDQSLECYAGYQSAGHTPEEWLKPDLVDILNELRTQNTLVVLIVPIQFLADHLEILYDLDIVARKQCEEFDIAYNRIELPNTDPFFLNALANIVRETKIR